MTEQRYKDALTELAGDMWNEGARPTQADYDRASELLGFTVTPSRGQREGHWTGEAAGFTARRSAVS